MGFYCKNNNKITIKKVFIFLYFYGFFEYYSQFVEKNNIIETV